MKKSEKLEQNRVRQPRAGGVGKTKAPAPARARAVKLSAPRRKEPLGLLEEHFAHDGEAHAVAFEYFNDTASEVLIAGSFNDWQPRLTPMKKKRGGTWSAELLLKPGHYEYRLVVDGEWQDDPMAARFVANPFGGLNAVIEVKSVETPVARQF